MKRKKIIGIVILICGIALILVSVYIKSRVASGRMEISNAQGQVNQQNTLFSISPRTEIIGRGFTGSAQGKINSASQEASQYEQRAHWLQIGGIVLIIIGIGIFFIARKK